MFNLSVDDDGPVNLAPPTISPKYPRLADQDPLDELPVHQVGHGREVHAPLGEPGGCSWYRFTAIAVLIGMLVLFYLFASAWMGSPL